MQENPKLNHLKKLSVLLDSQFTGPLGFKFGIDGLIGLIPFVGDLATSAMSFYIVFQAAMMGCSPSVILRMGLNILIDNLLDAFPGFGIFFDFFWKSNNKNIEIIEQHLVSPHSATVKSRLTLGLVAFSLLAVFIASISLTIFIFKSLLDWISVFSS